MNAEVKLQLVEEPIYNWLGRVEQERQARLAG